jgi:hypothetical protein
MAYGSPTIATKSNSIEIDTDLVAGLNEITHGFKLAAPCEVIVSIVDLATNKPIKGNLVNGDPLRLPIVERSANTIAINSPQILTKVKITIIG